MSTDDPASRMWGDAMTAHFDRRESANFPGVPCNENPGDPSWGKCNRPRGHSEQHESSTHMWWPGFRVAAADAAVQFDIDVNTVMAEASELLIRKHHDYGPRNVSMSPGGALNGLRVRLHDKTARINNLIDSGAEPENESLRDSFIDALNYCAIALLVLDGKWPE